MFRTRTTNNNPITSNYNKFRPIVLAYYNTVKKVTWSRYRAGVAQRVGRGMALLFLDGGTRRGWVVSSTPRPQITPGNDPVPILQEAGWAPGPVWTGGKPRPHRDSIPDRSARSQSLNRLSYPAHQYSRVFHIKKKKRKKKIGKLFLFLRTILQTVFIFLLVVFFSKQKLNIAPNTMSWCYRSFTATYMVLLLSRYCELAVTLHSHAVYRFIFFRRRKMYWPTHREFLNSPDEILSEETGTAGQQDCRTRQQHVLLSSWAVPYCCRPNYNKPHLHSLHVTKYPSVAVIRNDCGNKKRMIFLSEF